MFVGSCERNYSVRLLATVGGTVTYVFRSLRETVTYVFRSLREEHLHTFCRSMFDEFLHMFVGS